jgi:peptidoglycan glycosyltransferase
VGVALGIRPVGHHFDLLAFLGPSQERRRRLTHRAIPALAAVAFAIGLIAGSTSGSDAAATAARFARAWARADYAGMYALLSKTARGRTSRAAFEKAYDAAAATATATSIHAGAAHNEGPGARVAVAVATRVFGVVKGDVLMPVNGASIDWRPDLVFPGLPAGTALTRVTTAPRRASILARDGQTIASGPASARFSPPGSPAAGIAGTVAEPQTAAGRAALYSEGFPHGAAVGTSGLERALDARLRGRPGGTLRAGTRVLASSASIPSPPLRTTLDMHIQAAAELALAGRYGGIVALDARTAEIRALAGIATIAQPPGSTFKVITASAALQARLVRTTTTFPIRSRAIVDGVPLENANGESCGGTFANAFAVSCNSVFVPLGVKLGAGRLVAMAERFGFNSPPAIPNTAPSSIPTPREIRSALDVGSTAIGQGRVLATPLDMANAADTIANGGVRLEPTLVAGDRSSRTRAVSAPVAAIVTQLMIGVVAHGTGTSASLAPVVVAGKTGTAELGNTIPGQGTPTQQGSSTQINTDAWFTAFAPAGQPRIAVCAMFVKAGAGGDIAAPAARTVLQAGLAR